MSDWPGIDGEITSHSNLKLSVSRGSWGGDRGYFLLVIINCLASNVKIVFSQILPEYQSVSRICVQENIHQYMKLFLLIVAEWEMGQQLNLLFPTNFIWWWFTLRWMFGGKSTYKINKQRCFEVNIKSLEKN